MMSTKLRRNIVLGSICTVVAMGFCVPIIIYAIDSDRGGEYSTTSIAVGVDNCASRPKPKVNNSSVYDATCVNYIGQCTNYLLSLNNDSSLFTITLNGMSENDIASFIDILNQFSGIVSEQCAEIVLPFLCHYTHPPCDGNGSVNLISQEQCSNIRDVVCADEWRLVMATSSSSLLPVCEHFSDVDNITYDNTTHIISQPLQCHYQFKEYCGLCLPLCGKFSQYRITTKLRERILLIFAGAISFIGGILVFVAVIIRKKVLLDFPSILVVYSTVCTFVIACLILITYIGGQERLYCTHEILTVAYDNPSAFCQVSGCLFHWLVVLLHILWLLHLTHLYLKISFPIWARKLAMKKTKVLLHVTEITGAIILSGLAPVVFLSVSEYKFGRFPPVLCFPSRAVGFYTICVPLCIMIGCGMILTITTFWTLHRREQLFERSTKCFWIIRFSVPEVKILMLSCYFIVFGITALINVSISARDLDIILEKLFIYFICQSTGYNGPDTCGKERDELEYYLKPELNAVTYILLGLLPWSNLLFAVQVRDVKTAIQKLLSGCKFHDNSTSTVNESIH
ncbi:uncharacterized protein [Dysidea avara]|uniref:uncharacterized protein n=1 Tax=Dysidea avara TaxID=196820 RepID=UPI0033251ABB